MSKKQYRNPLVLALINLLALAVAVMGTAYAQDTGPEGVQQSSGLEEVIVTARKREESIQEVPVNVSAMGEQQIREKDVTNLEGPEKGDTYSTLVLLIQSQLP